MPTVKFTNLIVNRIVTNSAHGKNYLPMYIRDHSIYLCLLAMILTSQGTNASETQKIIALNSSVMQSINRDLTRYLATSKYKPNWHYLVSKR